MRQNPPPINRRHARDMRRDATKGEALLWQALRDRRLEQFKFRRQVPYGNYILDFVCFDAKLVIEVDGSQHAGSISDIARDAVLASGGFHVMRFWNDEIEESLNAVCLAILAVLRERSVVDGKTIPSPTKSNT